jgi:hypothetical protein
MILFPCHRDDRGGYCEYKEKDGAEKNGPEYVGGGASGEKQKQSVDFYLV